MTRHRHPAVWAHLTAAVLAAAAVGIVLAAPAHGHAVLEASEPEDGATVPEPLETVVLEFDEPVIAPEITVRDPTGADVAHGTAQVDGPRVTQPLAPLERTGRYTVSYQVRSADDHVALGELTFTYTGPTDNDSATAAPDDDVAPGARLWPLLALGVAAVAVLAAGAHAARTLSRRR